MFCSFNSGLALTKLLKAQVAASSRSLLLFPEPLLTVKSHPPGEGRLNPRWRPHVYTWQAKRGRWLQLHETDTGSCLKEPRVSGGKKISLSQNLRHQRPVNARSVTMFRTLGQQYSQCSCSSTRWARFKVMMGHSGSMCHTEPSNVGCTNTVSPSGHGAW